MIVSRIWLSGAVTSMALICGRGVMISFTGREAMSMISAIIFLR
jgi:hypothetical protein